MSSFKKNHIELCVVPLSKVHNLSVSMTIPFSCSAECIGLLCANNPCEDEKGARCNSLHNGSEEAALAYALFSSVREKLSGSPLEVARCKVDRVVCGAHENNFVIAWNTQGSGSALRKTIGVALKCLAPNSLYSSYCYNIRVLGGKPNRDEFDYLAGKMIEGLSKEIHFVAVGKIKADADFKSLLETAAKKYVPSKKVSGSAPPKHGEHKIECAKLKCDSGANAIIVSDYIRHQKFGLRVCGKYIHIYAGNWGSKQSALKNKDRISAYYATKYSKLDSKSDKLSNLFLAYGANSNALGAGHDIVALSKKTDIVGTILKCL